MKLLMRLSVKKLQKLLAVKKRLEKAAPLIAKRDAILKKVEEINKQLSGGPKRRGRKPGRPPKAGKRGRPAKKARTLSAAAKKRIALAVSKAQKARWAAFRKTKASKTKARSKTAQVKKTATKAKATTPKPGTLSAQIVQVTGSEQA